MRIAAYLMATLLVLVPELECTFRRRPSVNKHKGPFGGHLAAWGSTALDGLLRYAPDFYDVVPKVAHKLLAVGSKKHGEHAYDVEDDHSLIGAGKRTTKRINRLLYKPHGAHVAPLPAHHGHDHGFGGFDGFAGGYEHYPLIIPRAGFDELSVHEVFHEPIDFTHSFGSFFTHDLHNFDHDYQL